MNFEFFKDNVKCPRCFASFSRKELTGTVYCHCHFSRYEPKEKSILLDFNPNLLLIVCENQTFASIHHVNLDWDRIPDWLLEPNVEELLYDFLNYL